MKLHEILDENVSGAFASVAMPMTPGTKPSQARKAVGLTKKKKESVGEAVGEFAEPIYQLIDDLGGDNDAYEIVLDDLVRYMGGDTIKDFVADFRRDHDIGIGTLGQDESVKLPIIKRPGL